MEVVETCGKGTLSFAEPSAKRSITSIDEEVVGFGEDVECIIKKLTGGTTELAILSIFGMPGLGKTTLARKVYNHPTIVNHFDAKAWWCVSQMYSTRLFFELFKQTKRDERKIEEDADITEKVYMSLKGRRYLIVVDDIWEAEAWDYLSRCLPGNGNGSRVIVTTPNEEVAKNVQYNSDPYSVRFLTLEESWELLQKKVFRGKSCPPDLLDAGLQIAKHCKGLPLVIVLIAGIIGKLEKQASLWLEVANDLSCHVFEELTMKAIQSSYEHLEDHLKPCLLYMGLFLRKIPVSDLLKLWMAEEFVLNIDTENMEEASRVCLNDLLNRSLVMVYEKRINGDIEYCILPDKVRDFCLTKLEEEKFMQLTVPYTPYKHLCAKESRLCIYILDDHVKQFDRSEYLLDTMFESKETEYFGQCPRTLEFITHPEFNAWKTDGSILLTLLVKLRLVRVLHLMDVKLPSSWIGAVQSLTHLRYLALHVEDQFEFKWVSHLHNLQTLQLYSSNTVILYSTGLWEMTKLRHVNISNSYLELGDDEANIEESSEILLENLKTFGCCSLDLEDTDPRFWWRLPNLEELKLDVQRIRGRRSLFPIPEVHTRLQSLDLGCPRGSKLYLSAGWESYFNVFPSNLKDLCLSFIALTEEIISNIARLRKLESLKLYQPLLLGKDQCWDVRHIEFPALKYLTLELVDMTEWNASEESFPMLEKLVINRCPMLKGIPPSFVDIPTLQLIDVFFCMGSLGISAINIKREIEETTGCDRLQVLISREKH